MPALLVALVAHPSEGFENYMLKLVFWSFRCLTSHMLKIHERFWLPITDGIYVAALRSLSGFALWQQRKNFAA